MASSFKNLFFIRRCFFKNDAQRLVKHRRCFCRNTKPRQKQWSDHNYFFLQIQQSHINNGSVGVLLVMRRQSSIVQAFCGTTFKRLMV
jgi:hypothetical protein